MRASKILALARCVRKILASTRCAHTISVPLTPKRKQTSKEKAKKRNTMQKVNQILTKITTPKKTTERQRSQTRTSKKQQQTKTVLSLLALFCRKGSYLATKCQSTEFGYEVGKISHPIKFAPPGLSELSIGRK